MIYNQICEELLDFFHLRKKPCKYCGKPTSCSCGCCHEPKCNEKYYAEQNAVFQRHIEYITSSKNYEDVYRGK